MSQERTEQFAFDPDKVRQLLVDLVKDSLIHGLPISSQKYVLSDLAEAHEEIERMDIVIAEQADYINAINKSSDGLDTAVYLHMCHIDRLNAVINDLNAEVSELNEEISRYRWNEYEYGAKNAALDLIVDDLTAKVQERDEEIQVWIDRQQVAVNLFKDRDKQVADRKRENDWLRDDLHKRDKEIERLRAALVEASEALDDFTRIDLKENLIGDIHELARIARDDVNDALKGAE